MKILITGGAGFLGSNLSKRVIENNDELIVFDNLRRIGSESNLKWLSRFGEFKFVHGDIRNYNDIGDIIRKFKPDAIFHTAGQVAMTTSIENPILDFEINALGTLNILECIRKFSKDSIIVYSSTNKVYGDLNQFSYEETSTRYICNEYPYGFNETIPLDFQTPYGISKGTADQYMLEYYRSYGLKTVVFRHSSIYGERQFATIDQGWIGWFIQKAIEKKNSYGDEPFTISGNGKQVRDLLYIDDVIDLYFKAILKINELSGLAFNIGGGLNNSFSLLELFSFLENELKIKMNYKNLPSRLSDQKVFITNFSKIKEKLGWKPKISKEDGINKMINWVESYLNKYAEGEKDE